MDIMIALTAATRALELVRGLRDGERGLDRGELKAAVAELYEKLADVKMALVASRHDLQTKDQTIRDLEGRIETLMSGGACPICQEGWLKVMAVRPHPVFGLHGLEEHTLKCSNCDHAELRKHDPRDRGQR